MKINTPLEITEIDFRVQSINKGGFATILAYKDARVDMNRLDAVYGVECWQKKYEIIDGNLFCSVGVWSVELQQWIWKMDVGTESNTEKEKGQASDAFKRACFNFGIGRELYDYPLIQVKLLENEFDKTTGKPTWDFRLKEWKWRSQFIENKLVYLDATDNKGTQRFVFNIIPKEVKPAPVINVERLQNKLKNATTPDEVNTIYKSFTAEEKKASVEFAIKLGLELKTKLENGSK